jgi:hypothetical protein
VWIISWKTPIYEKVMDTEVYWGYFLKSPGLEDGDRVGRTILKCKLRKRFTQCGLG